MAKTLRGEADLLHGPVLQNMLRFALPILAGTLLQQLYSMVDAVVVGQFVGKTALAAVGGSAVAIINLLLNFFVGLCSGAAIVVAQYYGAHDRENVSRAVHTATLLAVWVGAVMTVIGVCFAPGFLTALDTPEDTMQYSIDYMRWYFAGMIPTMIYNMGSSILRAMGDSKRPLYFLLVASVLNIGLDLLCILTFRMGAFGAAFATVFSQAVAGIGSLIYIGRHYPELKWSREEGRLSASHCLKLCNMGIPMGLQCSITAIGSVVLQGAVNGLGSSIVAAQTAGSKAAQFLSVPLESIGTAMTTYASQNMGAHDLKRVDRGVNTALGIGCVYSVASFLILRVLDVPLISLFLESSEVEIMANARSFIFWNSVFYIPLAVLIIYRYTIQGLGYSGLAMFAGVAEMVARAMVGFWFVPLWGYFAACIANPVAWFFACFFLIPAYFAVRNRLTKELAAARVED